MRNDACGLPLKKKTMMLRKTQNQNDADDANDAESGIWYRDILKTASLASQASSASLSSRKNSAGVWGYAPEMCMWMTTCYASKTCSRSKRGGNQSGCAYKFVYTPEWISLDSSKNLDSKKWISSDSLCTNELLFIKKVHQDFSR